MHSILSRYRGVSEKWFFRMFRNGFSLQMECYAAETLATSELAKNANPPKYINNTNNVLFRHRGTESDLCMQPTCEDEAEALRHAPPWAGMWRHKPTLTQRLMLWIRWWRRHSNRPLTPTEPGLCPLTKEQHHDYH